MEANNPTHQELKDKIVELETKLAKTQWLHEKENIGDDEPYTPYYGDVTELNTERTILDNVGKETLKILTSDLMNLLQTSVAIYEKNGDYAYGKFNSAWCQLLDASSRKLCNTDDNKIALTCGKWHCHEDCWNNSAKAAIINQKSTDIDCIGGIKLYAEPIFVDNEVIGTINIGYGNPPTDDETLKELSEKYSIDFETLKQKAINNNPRPDFIIEMAKKRLKSITKLIGEIVSRKQIENELIKATKKAEEAQNKLSLQLNFTSNLINSIPIPLFYKDKNGKYLGCNPVFESFTGTKKQELLNKTTLELWPTKQAEVYRQKDLELMQKGGSQNYEYEVEHADGSLKDVIFTKTCFTDNNNEVDGIIGTYVDITNRKKAEENLLKTKTILEEAEELSNIGSYEWNIPENELTLSEGWQKIHGVKKKVLKTHELMPIAHPDDRAKVENAQHEALNNIAPYNLEHRIIRQTDNETRIIKSRGKVIFNEKGEPLKMYGSVEDITESKIAKEERRISDERFRIAQDMSPDGFTIFKPVRDNQNRIIDFTWVYQNAAIAKMNGTDPQEVVGQSLLELFPGAHGTQFWNTYIQVAETGEPMTFEDAYAGETMETKLWFRIVVVPMDKNIAILAHNITERKISEQALKESEEKFRIIFENSVLGIFRSKPEGKYEIVNNAFARILGFNSPQQVLDEVTDISKLYKHSEDRELILKELTDKGYVKDYEVEANHSTNQIVWVSINAIKRQYPNGSSYYEGTIQNVTDRKQVEQEIKKYTQELEEANATKNKFFNIVAHDLKNPFTTIIGFSNLLKKNIDKYDKDKIYQFVDNINTSSQSTFKLLENLLEWSRAQTGKITFNPEKLILEDIVIDIIQQSSDITKTKSITIDYCIPSSITICADRNMLSVILRNLTINAIKFTNQGGKITINATQNDNETVIKISDNGIGMSASIKNNLFKIDEKVSRAGTSNETGTGLGLLLCKEFVHKHRGRIWAESEEDKGSIFFFTIPNNN